MSDSSGQAWPREVYQAALLRGLDERGRDELTKAGALHEVAAGDTVYRRGDTGRALYVVASGKVSLLGLRRGEEQEVELRRAGPSESFGEEASMGASFRATAKAESDSLVAELPVALVRRALVRVGGNEVADRFERRVRRRATAELLATQAFTAELPPDDLELLLDAAEHREVLRGEVIYREGEPATHLWFVADGMVQLQTMDDERLRVRAYLVRGDFFGDEELLSASPRQTTAVASGATLLVGIGAEVARTVIDRNPTRLRRLRRVAQQRLEQQQAALGDAVGGETQHAFRDLYRLQVARSLLVIDLDNCVRCGHCAWACETLHGVARLVRRGDKIVTRVAEGPERSPLLLPNSCQHCDNPACMPDCPTGAIGRDPRGEVYIRDELCTGCGACAKGCPWDNIQIVPRPASAPRPPAPHGVVDAYGELAVKCDLCSGYQGPACVKACPTEAIWRVNPADDLPEVGLALGRTQAPKRERPSARAPWTLLLAAAAVGAALAGYGGWQHQRGAWQAWRGSAWAFGIVAALCFVALGSYSLPKRLVRLWSRRRDASLRRATESSKQPVRSLVAPQLTAHVALGLLSLGPAVAHGGMVVRASSGGALLLAFFASAALGLIMALCYRFVPRRLSRLERSAALPEDMAALSSELRDQLYAGVSGRSEVVKRIFEKMLVPYLRAPLGWLRLVVSGRSLRDEQRALRRRIDEVLEGRGGARLGGLEALIRAVVEIRALRAQRVLTALLRLGLPLHLLTAAVAGALLVAHLLEVLG